MLLEVLQRVEQSQDFIHAAAQRQVVDRDVTDDAGLVDDEQAAEGDADGFDEHAVIAADRLIIPTLLTSAKTGQGLPRLREILANRATVFSGQSGVGKSSLLNAIQPELALRVKTVSEQNQKGRHTTTTAELIKLETGGWVVDTPGVRQLQLWDTRPEEVEMYFREFRPFIARCGFPDCTHTHERTCAVKDGVQRRLLSERRYMSYIGMFNGLDEE